MAVLGIHSQINTTSTGLTTSSGWITAGFSPNGWFADGIGAVRFQLPEDFSGVETIYSVTLSINASAVGGSGSWCKTWIGIISGAQTLPADYMGLSSASTRSPQRILGGYTSDGVDATVSGTKTVLNLSLTDAFLAAQSDGALSSGYVVILFYPHSNNGGAAHQIDGLGSGTPATLTFEYAEPGPPPELNDIYYDVTLSPITLESEVTTLPHTGVGLVVLDPTVVESTASEIPVTANYDVTLSSLVVESTADELPIEAEYDVTLQKITLEGTLDETSIEANLDVTLQMIQLTSLGGEVVPPITGTGLLLIDPPLLESKVELFGSFIPTRNLFADGRLFLNTRNSRSMF